MTATLNCLIIVWSGGCVLLSIFVKMCSSILALLLDAICSNILLGSSNYQVKNLLGVFLFCSLFCISPLLHNSLIKSLVSVRVSVWPDGFTPSRTSNLMQISFMLDGMIIGIPWPSKLRFFKIGFRLFKSTWFRFTTYCFIILKIETFSNIFKYFPSFFI